MPKEAIYTPSGPVLGSPYTPAVKAGNLIFISGQVPLDPTISKIVDGGIEAQARQCLANLQAILAREDLTLDDVVKTTVFLADLNDFGAMNRVYGAAFTGIKPARSCVQVARIPMDALVEIEAIALKP
jgi:2-iminobutanoate/2-iminopropanoate deaminase